MVLAGLTVCLFQVLRQLHLFLGLILLPRELADFRDNGKMNVFHCKIRKLIWSRNKVSTFGAVN